MKIKIKIFKKNIIMDIDTYISTNLPTLLKFIDINYILNFILRSDDLHESYRAIYPYLLRTDFVTYNRDLYLDLELLPEIDNLEHIANLFLKINDNRYFYKLVNILNKVERDEILNFCKRMDIDFDNVRLDHLIFNLTDIIYDTKIIQRLMKYSDYTDLEHPLLKLKFRGFESLEIIQSLESINYQFNYLMSIVNLESFDYLYNQTNFNEYLNYNLKHELYRDPKQNILNYLTDDFELIKKVSTKYLGQEIKNLINYFDLTNMIIMNPELLQFLAQHDYDFKSVEFYKIVHDHLRSGVTYGSNVFKNDSELLDTFLTLNVSDEINMLCYIYLAGLKQHNQIFYDRITKFNFVDYTDMLIFIDIEQLEWILVKLDDINQIFYCIMKPEHLEYILNHYDGIDPNKLVDSFIYRSNKLLGDIQFGQYKMNNTNILKYYQSIIKIFKDYNYYLSNAKIDLFENFNIPTDDDDEYILLSDILMEIWEN